MYNIKYVGTYIFIIKLFFQYLLHPIMDLKQGSSTDWCQDDFDPDDDDDINRAGPSGLKHNTGHFLVECFLY